ncbi:hypothetical protein SHJG_1074 [Streptomyces hygroscopicus subsp. jinggangensis 5008]|nr:hypothetical protein SHJG_1074 [Streptomyces hygroscopicus subsp. jinggangensis 5008]AGF60575.1 hypothetical protein SHJGH_0909 [Streptomyces hygroscopicus subsp. jinggangensis TL01]
MRGGRGQRGPPDGCPAWSQGSTTAPGYRTHVFRSGPDPRDAARVGVWRMHGPLRRNGYAKEGGWPKRRC